MSEFIKYDGVDYASINYIDMDIGDCFDIKSVIINDDLLSYIKSKALSVGRELVLIGNPDICDICQMVCVGVVNSDNQFGNKLVKYLSNMPDRGASKTNIRRKLGNQYNQMIIDAMVSDGVLETFYHDSQKKGRKTTYYILCNNDNNS